MELVIFACVHNAGRSQMAAALFNRNVSVGVARAMSAGTNPGDAIYPEVIQVMADLGVESVRRHAPAPDARARGGRPLADHDGVRGPVPRATGRRPRGLAPDRSQGEAAR